MSKKRLVELIEKAKVLRSLDILSGDPDVIVDMPTEDEYIADYLLANGVIVPPCKVGDVVYTIHRDEILVAKVHGIETKNYPTCSCVYLELSLMDKTGFTFSKKLLYGKTAFLTREEAEKKLKEGESK